MGNPISQLLARVSPAGQMLNQATDVAKAMQDPNPMGALMAQSDPRMGQVMDLIKQRGGNPEQVFYALAKERGVNPEEILSMVRGLIQK